jgi:hypothetical protein
MLHSIGNICRVLGIVSFLLMSYAWFYTSDLQLFRMAKEGTILFFSISIVLWLVSIVIARKNR